MCATDVVGHVADREAGAAKAVDRPSVDCVGSRYPAVSHMRYFHAVKACSARHSWKSDSVRFDRNTRHASSNSTRAWSKVAAVPWVSLPRMTARIEATRPAPRVFPRRDADTLGDRADADVAAIDVPTLVLGVEIAAAGEGGHLSIKARPDPIRK